MCIKINLKYWTNYEKYVTCCGRHTIRKAVPRPPMSPLNSFVLVGNLGYLKEKNKH